LFFPSLAPTCLANALLNSLCHFLQRPIH
jgi:hypothetical protein